MQSGAFTISLDLELFWGVRDKRELESYRANLQGVHDAVPRMLDIFAEFDVAATWAFVGLGGVQPDKLDEVGPELLPSYDNSNLSPYKYLEREALDETDPCHFYPDLLRQIADTPRQELATHTFSHYYCLEAGQSAAEFRADLEAAVRVGERYGVTPTSLVFPRNQYRPDYLAVLPQVGLSAYRGNPKHWLYAASSDEDQTKVRRAARLVDAYVNISGHHTHVPQPADEHGLVDVSASRLLRSYSRKLSVLEPLRINRMRRSLGHAARHNEVFHLWWHPHNFGVNLKENMGVLRKVLTRFAELREDRGMVSLTMGELATLCKGQAA